MKRKAKNEKLVKASKQNVIGEDKGAEKPFPPLPLVKVYFTDRDFEYLSDCDDVVQELISDLHPALVELTFPAKCHDAIVQSLDSEGSGWGDDVKVIASTGADGVVSLTMSHERGRERRR